MNTCIVCGQPLKLIPAGVSRTTGKPYGAFYACQDKSHKQTPTMPQNNQPVYVPNTGQPTYKPVEKKPDWDTISKGKVRHGVALEAIKKDMPLNGVTKVWIDAWTDYIMTGSIKEQDYDPMSDPSLIPDNPF